MRFVKPLKSERPHFVQVRIVQLKRQRATGTNEARKSEWQRSRQKQGTKGKVLIASSECQNQRS